MTRFRVPVALAVTDLGCDRGGEPIVRSVSFTALSGSAVQIFGGNGSGKSTLLNVLAGVMPSAAGSINWTTGGIAYGPEAPGNALVFVGHDTTVKPALTAWENLMYWARLYRIDRHAVESAIIRVGLERQRDDRGGQLSAGQKRRLDLARALIANRPVWILDEPSASLDDDGHSLVSTLIHQHQEDGGIAVIATHDRHDIVSTNIRLG